MILVLLVAFVYVWGVFCTSVAHALWRDGVASWICVLVVLVPFLGLCYGLAGAPA